MCLFVYVYVFTKDAGCPIIWNITDPSDQSLSVFAFAGVRFALADDSWSS